MSYKVGLIAILFLLVLIFLAQNSQVVTVTFLFWEISMSRALLIFFLFLIGLILGWLLHSFSSYSRNRKISG